MKYMKMIRAAEAARTDTRNLTRIYSVVNPLRNGEFRLDTYAVRSVKGGIVAKKVGKWWSDRTSYKVSGRVLRNLVYNTLFVNWCDFGGSKHNAVFSDVDACVNEWCTSKHEFGGSFDIPEGKVLNIGDLASTNYRYWGWSENLGMRMADYMVCYRASPLTEHLGKSRLRQFLTPAFVSRLRDDGAFRKWFVRHMDEVANGNISAVSYAYGHGTSVDDAMYRQSFLRQWRGVRIPVEDIRAFSAWAKRNEVCRNEYADYIRALGILGIPASHMPMPTRRTMDEIKAQAIARVGIQGAEDEVLSMNAAQIAAYKKHIVHVKLVCGYLSSAELFGGYELKVLRTLKEYREEGAYMHNCIGQVYRPGSSQDIIVSVRKDGVRVADMRMDAVSMDLRECRARFNKDAPKDIMDLAESVSASMRKRCA